MLRWLLSTELAPSFHVDVLNQFDVTRTLVPKDGLLKLDV